MITAVGRAGIAALLVGALSLAACARDEPSPRPASKRVDAEIDAELAKDAKPDTIRDGLAAVVLIDVSGSMREEVADAKGGESPKIELARRAALGLVDQFARYATDHPTEPVLLSVYEFSSGRDHPSYRQVVAMGRPDRQRAEPAIAAMEAGGGTPIGDAMIQANRDLDRTGLARRHLLVVTDGENTDGFKPDDVARALSRRPEGTRASLYFVAFDIEASRFSRVRDAGGLVLSAANEPELGSTLDSLLRGKILIER